MLKVFEYNGQGISFDFDGETYINATEMAKHFGKRPIDFLKLKSTHEYIEVLKSEVKNPHFAKKGGDLNEIEQGTWMHELLALEFAGWLSPKFKVWCNQKIKELITNGSASLHDLEPEELLLKQVQMLVEQKKKIKIIENKVNEIEARTYTRPDYFTVVGYATLNGITVNLKLAARVGQKASLICKKHGYPTDLIPDPRFGTVKSYPKHVLEEVFNQNLN
jgi:hypothetical protein